MALASLQSAIMVDIRVNAIFYIFQLEHLGVR
jgi:hypothetical protein